MKEFSLYRKRIIPPECILLKDDNIVHQSKDIIVTTWGALHPKKDLHHGISGYFFKEGFKLSKFYKEDGSLIYWYIDIIDSEFDAEENSLFVRDLLADILIYPDGFVKVVDIDELAQVLTQKALAEEVVAKALCILNDTLQSIYSGNFKEYQDFVEKFEN